jgi:hypothetical protein
VIAADLATALAGATDIPHAGEDLAPGILQIAPVGFQPGEASYFIRVEHVALRYAVTIEAAPFSGRLLGSVVERLDQKPELGEEIAVDIAALGWEVRQTPRAGSPVLFDAREGNAILGTTEDTRHGRLTEVCIRLTRFMLGSLAVTQIPSHTRAAKQRVETTAQNVTWENDPAERDRSTATHRRLENWLIARLAQEGIRPLDPDGDVEFDLAWVERDGSLSVCEVKSTSGHEDKQVRLGFGQVLHYIARLRASWPRAINPVLFVEAEPLDPVWLPLCHEHGIVLAWPNSWDRIRSTESDDQHSDVKVG